MNKTACSIIAISGKSGCGNSTVSSLVAQKLERKLINYTFHNMAKELNIPFSELLSIAKKDYSYDKKLDNKQVEMAREADSVIASRLAIWLVPDALLKVYLYASSEVRAQRVFNREGGDFSQVLSFTKNRDAEDRQRYLEIYGIDNDIYNFADIIINTEKYSPEGISDIIIAASGVIL